MSTAFAGLLLPISSTGIEALLGQGLCHFPPVSRESGTVTAERRPSVNMCPPNITHYIESIGNHKG